MTQPFEGVRVLDFTQVFAGPYGSYQLALLGADVIKVERPGGEDMRRSPLSREWADRNMASAFMSINANKRDLALDLTKPEAVEIIHRLARRADVVIENFRPGVMDKLGIGQAALSDLNPRLIYCALSGFGQNGPARRALEAELLDSTEPLQAALRALGERASEARDQADEIRAWRAWALSLRNVFEAADRVWVTLDDALDAAHATASRVSSPPARS